MDINTLAHSANTWRKAVSRADAKRDELAELVVAAYEGGMTQRRIADVAQVNRRTVKLMLTEAGY